MTNNLDEKFNNAVKDAKKTSLLPKEKEGIKLQLLRLIKEPPQQKAFFANINYLPINNRTLIRYASVALLVLLVGGISLSVAATDALPGDPLYTIKTGVNEKVIAMTLLSDQAKAEYDINLAQLRLEEIETVALQNKLTSRSAEDVRTLLSDHLKDIQKRIVNIKEKEDIRIALELKTKLEGVLKDHEQTINKLTGK